MALEALGLTVEGFQAAGTLMALSRLALDYRGPLRAGDTFYVTTAIAEVGGWVGGGGVRVCTCSGEKRGTPLRASPQPLLQKWGCRAAGHPVSSTCLSIPCTTPHMKLTAAANVAARCLRRVWCWRTAW